MVRIWRYLRKIWLPFQQAAAPQHSAAVCYYLLLSIPSFLSLFLRLYVQFPHLSQSLQQTFHGVIPTIFWEMADSFFWTFSAPETLSLSFAAILWSVSKAIAALTEGLNSTLGVKTQERFFQKRLRALLLFLLLTVSILGALSFIVYGQQFLSFFQSLMNQHLVSAHLFAIIYLSVCFTIIYRIFPYRKQPLKCCFLGATAAAIGWYGFSCLYSAYISILKNPADPFGAILLFMIWLHICFTVLFYGSVLTKLLSEKHVSFKTNFKRIIQGRKQK